jgi:hypothetical protein
MFLPYLRAAFNAIKPEVAQPRNLTDFFQEELFIEIVKEESEESRDSDSYNIKKATNFATQLLTSRSFVHFMDGYLSDDVTNFDLVNSILCFRGVLDRRFKAPQVTLAPYSEKVQ